MLYVISTPIGNRADITLHALELLKNCDYILSEDTRHSKHLLTSYEIATPLVSFHKFNEAKREKETLADLHAGKEIALITDAGTPLISDPGFRLIEECHKEGIAITSVPGACSVIAALSVVGFPTEPFQFVGFLPKKESARKKKLFELLQYPGTTVCFESPQRVASTLTLVQQLEPKRLLAIARELTKKHEEVKRGSAQELLEYFEQSTLKGECVFLLSPPAEDPAAQWKDLSLEEHMQWIETHFNLSKKEAIKVVCDMRNIPKREGYSALLARGEKP